MTILLWYGIVVYYFLCYAIMLWLTSFMHAYHVHILSLMQLFFQFYTILTVCLYALLCMYMYVLSILNKISIPQ